MERPHEYSSEAPFIQVRWLRPTTSTVLLQLPTTPVAVNHIDTWVALSAEESLECEAAWNNLSKEEQTAALESSRDITDTLNKPQDVIEESDSEDETVGVTIFQDRLFEVDVRSMELKPIYWRSNGPKINVRRATWMYDETRPVNNDLCGQLDAAYRLIQPWQESYQLELEAARKIGIDGYDKLKYPITSSGGGDSPKDGSRIFVVFEDAFTAILTTGGTTSFASSIFSTKSSQSKTLPFLGVIVFYGYDSALAAKESKSKKSSPRNSLDKDREIYTNAPDIPSPTGDKATPISIASSERVKTKPPVSVGDSGPKKVTDLVLIVHGIGQALALQYESWSFLYAVNLFRQIARKQSALPSLASILRDKQVQFLPVEWRASLKLGEDEQREREREGLDNSFTVADITPKKSISLEIFAYCNETNLTGFRAIREVTNNVLIDIPYFMSRHHKAMIESVCKRANRIYRQWCARNPGFEVDGRVHIVAHSLGAVLSAYILSDQPTYQPPLFSMPSEMIRQCRDQFIFNTCAFFTIGSPLPIFIHLNNSQVIARQGRARTKGSPDDEAMNKRNFLGCFATDAFYNILHPSDPIAYLINPCVDAKAAVNMPPSILPTFNESVISGLSNRFSRMLEDVMPRSFVPSPPRSRMNSPVRPGSKTVPSTFELQGHNESLQGSRAERRFAALNPHGTVDFQLASEGSISEYVDMIGAHSSYWQDADLAAFILVELFASQQDLDRTGLIPSSAKVSTSIWYNLGSGKVAQTVAHTKFPTGNLNWFMTTGIFALPLEIIESILLFATPSAVGAFSQTCKTYYSLIYSGQDNHFWRNLFLAQGYDDPRLRLEHKRATIQWTKLVQGWVATAKVLREARPITSLDTIRSLLDLIDYSRPGPEVSLNLLLFENLIDECGDISTLVNNFIGDETDVASERMQLAHRLKVYIGLAAAERTPEARLKARTYVYSLRNYSEANSYGPFLPDNSGSVNWVHLFRVYEILVMNAMDFVYNHQTLLPSAVHDLQQKGVMDLDIVKDERDWAGITGKWQLVFSFCDHRDLMAFNDPYTYPRRAMNIFEAEDFEEALRIIEFDFTVSGVSHVSDNDEWSTRPTLHFIGKMGDAHRITGRVYMGPDGQVNWSFVSGEGVPMWSIRLVQIGGVGSTYGALGTWTTVTHESDDPVGPTWIRKYV